MIINPFPTSSFFDSFDVIDNDLSNITFIFETSSAKRLIDMKGFYTQNECNLLSEILIQFVEFADIRFDLLAIRFCNEFLKK